MVFHPNVECSYKTTPTYETMNTSTTATRHSGNVTGMHSSIPREWKDSTVTYTDGSIFSGYLTHDGKRTGFGTCRYPIMLYGEVTDNSDSLFHWMEYVGVWENDQPTTGRMTRVCGDGKRILEFEGNWRDGYPVEDNSERFDNH
jgi:hypothetical protein